MTPTTGITIPARAQALGEVAALLDALAARHHFDADAVGDLQLALDEVLAQAMRCQPAGADPIRVEFALRGRTLEAQVLDDGPAIDGLPGAAPAGSEATAGAQLGAFVARLVDAVRQDRSGPRHRLVLAKRVLR